MSNQPSPEEIKKRIELMKENCIFCKIAKKEIEGKIVFEDDVCMAVLDINPASTGHLLLFPKEHYMLLPMVPDEVLSHLALIGKSLSDLLKASFNATDVTFYMANGAAAGQQVQHFITHIIPRYEGDKLIFSSTEGIQKAEELEELAEKIKSKLEMMNSSL